MVKQHINRDNKEQQQELAHIHHDTKKNGLLTNLKNTWSEWAEEQNRKNAERASKPDNIVVLKFAVVLCVGLLVWCYYVYVARICTPMIRQEARARGSKSEGIVFLIFFNILWLLMSYSYAMVILTTPGFATDVVQRSPRPEPPWLGNNNNNDPYQSQQAFSSYPPLNQSEQQYHAQFEAQLTAGATPQVTHMQQQREGDNHYSHTNGRNHTAEEGVGRWHQSARPASGVPSNASTEHTMVQQAPTMPSDSALHSRVQPKQISVNNMIRSQPLDDTQNVADRYGKTGALGAGIANAAAALDTTTNNNRGETLPGQQRQESMENAANPYQSHPPYNPLHPNTAERGHIANSNGNDTFYPKVYREPPLRLPLHPNTLYCERCEIVKPPRTHHCRHCGTCVLGMDHHCPWIGQCCGARNHIYFMTFCFWACIALGYVFVTILVALIAPNASPQPATLDAQSIVICAIAAVLSFFTGSMTVSHIILILKARSTIEDISASDMKRRETSALNRVYPLFALKAKKRERNEWNRVWGRLDKEANLFWQGSNKKNWELIMGNSWWKWIITPPKYVPDDGLSYKPNPRRGSNGEWKTRDQWPREYQ